MTAITEKATASARSTDTTITGLVSAAHFVSHYYFNVLPPLFFLVRPEFGVSYQEIGLALVVFHVVSAVVQTPAGFLVDRISAKWSLIAGLVVGGGAFVLAGMVSNFYVFIAMFALAGIANTVYHPADYSILSRRISTERMSHAFSVHVFAGYIGTAVTPACQVLLAELLGWRGAFVAAGGLGLAVGLMLMLFGRSLSDAKTDKPKAAERSVGWDILLSPAILLNVVFFILIALGSGGIQAFGLVALQELRGFSVSLATTALSIYLGIAAVGVIAGGFLAARATRQDLIAMGGMAMAAIAIIPVGVFDLGPILILILMGIAGFFTGLITASRDLLVRAVTPAGAFGAVFGYVTTGFAIGGILTPVIYGWFMDHGRPGGVFLAAAFFSLLVLPILAMTRTQPVAKPQPAE
jgi:FSR family fosmidomycin resistance protein-like MFS transporter